MTAIQVVYSALAWAAIAVCLGVMVFLAVCLPKLSRHVLVDRYAPRLVAFMLMLSFVMLVVLSFGISGADAGGTVASSWASVLAIVIGWALVLADSREGTKGRPEATMLTAIVVTNSCYAMTNVAYFGYHFGLELRNAVCGVDIAAVVVGLFISVLLWHYVRLVANLRGRLSKALTVVVYILAAVASLLTVSDPLTDLVIQYSVEEQQTEYTELGFAIIFVPFLLIDLAMAVVMLARKMDRVEKSSLLALTIASPVSILGMCFLSGDIYVAQLCTVSCCVFCHLGVSMRRAEILRTHMAQVELASTIQQGMLPHEFPCDPRLDAFADMWPAKEVAGDFYDIYRMDDDHVYLTIADVSGKDVPAAIFMSKANALIREYEKMGLEPQAVFDRVNAALSENNPERLFVTAWMGLLDLKSGVLVFANAGHNPPLVLHGGKASFIEEKANLILGVRAKTRYARQSLLLRPSDRILLYTDGAVEAVNAAKEEYGNNRLAGYLASCGAAPVEECVGGLYRSVCAFAAGEEQFDDVTVVCANFRGGDPALLATSLEEKVFTAADNELDAVQGFVTTSAIAAGAPERLRGKVEMCVEEVFINISHYAYPEGARGKVRATVLGLPGEVRVTFADTGAPFDPLGAPTPDFEERKRSRTVGGLGVHMVKTYMDAVSYEHANGENRLTLTIAVPMQT